VNDRRRWEMNNGKEEIGIGNGKEKKRESDQIKRVYRASRRGLDHPKFRADGTARGLISGAS